MTFRSRKTVLSAGYTLVETAAVLTILTLVLTGLLIGYKIYMRQMTDNKQFYAGIEVKSAISRFMMLEGRVPCPADASLARTDARYGFENCTGVNPPTDPFIKADGSSHMGASPVCNQTIGGLCNTNRATTNIRRGMLPFATLEIAEDKAYDAYGMRLVYMASMKQTNATTYTRGGGTIGIRDVATVGGLERSLIDPADKADFVVFSAGPDRVGAFSKSGPTTIDGDGRTRLTSLPVPCTTTNTGGAGEFANCDPLGEIVYAGDMSGRRFDHTTAPMAWNTSPFLDDSVVYTPLNGVGFWRRSTVNKRDAVLLNPLGEVGIDSANGEKLDLGLAASTPESAVRSSGAFIAGRNPAGAKVCDNSGNNCFDPKDIAGNPMVGFWAWDAATSSRRPNAPTGGVFCGKTLSGAPKLMTGIHGDTPTNALHTVPECVNPFTSFCPPGDFLKGFDPSGAPLCTNAASTTCSATIAPDMPCSELTSAGKRDNHIAYNINYYLSGAATWVTSTPSQAWTNSALTGINSNNQTLPAGNQGDTATVAINTVELFNQTNSCADLLGAGKVTNTHGNSAYSNSSYPAAWASADFANQKFCRFGFNGAQRVHTYKCDGGAWVLDSKSGVCTQVCTPTNYPQQILNCGDYEWSHNNKPGKVKLAHHGNHPHPSTDIRPGLDTRTVWSGTFTIPAGTSCGGVLPAVAHPSTYTGNTCACTGAPINYVWTETCSLGDTVNPATVSAGAVVAGSGNRQYLRRTTFTCDLNQDEGKWSTVSEPPAYDTASPATQGCKCTAGAVNAQAHSCAAGTTASTPGPVRSKTSSCTSTGISWPAAWTYSGSCTCVPKVQAVDTGAAYKVSCSANDLQSGWVGHPGEYGNVMVTVKYDQACDGSIAGIATDDQSFYTNKLPGTKSNYTYTHDNGVSCHPKSGHWVTTSGALGNVLMPPSPMIGDVCMSAADQAACLAAGGTATACAADAPKKCYQTAGPGTWTKYDCACN